MKTPILNEDIEMRKNLCPCCQAALGEPENARERIIERFPQGWSPRASCSGSIPPPAARRTSSRAMPTARRRAGSASACGCRPCFSSARHGRRFARPSKLSTQSGGREAMPA